MSELTLEKLLKTEFKISPADSKFYLTVLNYGMITAGEISSILDTPLDDVLKGLNRLSKKNLIKKVNGVIPRFIANTPDKGLLQ